MRFLLMISMALLFSASAMAQSYTEMYEQVSTLNRVQPLQNPTMKRTYEIINRKIQDRKTKVVGQVSDVLISKYGPVDSINADLNRLRLGNNVVLNMKETGIEGRRDTYAFLNYDEEGIKDIYPELLANIQTAAGSEDDLVSLNNLVGASVKNIKGETIGKVDDVLFNTDGNVAQALYVDVLYKTSRGDVAIPFGAADYSNLSTKREITLANDQVKAVTDYLAKAKK